MASLDFLQRLALLQCFPASSRTVLFAPHERRSRRPGRDDALKQPSQHVGAGDHSSLAVAPDQDQVSVDDIVSRSLAVDFQQRQDLLHRSPRISYDHRSVRIRFDRGSGAGGKDGPEELVRIEGPPRLVVSRCEDHPLSTRRLDTLDEVFVFVAPKIVGGREAPAAIAGCGIKTIRDALSLARLETRVIDKDVYVRGRISKS